MSTLTKILIVLLTLSSIFLCGITVTYVGTATNYKKAFEERRSKISSLTEKNNELSEQINKLNEEKSATASTHENSIKLLRDENDQISIEKTNLEREIEKARLSVQNYEAIVTANTETVKLNNDLRKQLEAKTAELEALKTNSNAKIDELANALVSKDATIDLNEKEKKRLIEEKTQIQNKLDQLLRVVSLRAGTSGSVTGVPDTAQLGTPIVNINLEGVISEVKLQDSLASISIGSAKGVKDGMKFHVIRGEKYICDIVIFSADADQASGYFDLVGENQPRAGDIVKTNF